MDCELKTNKKMKRIIKQLRAIWQKKILSLGGFFLVAGVAHSSDLRLRKLYIKDLTLSLFKKLWTRRVTIPQVQGLKSKLCTMHRARSAFVSLTTDDYRKCNNWGVIKVQR